MIEVTHLIRACEGDVEKLSGLASVLALASFGLGFTNAREGTPLAIVNEQLQHWTTAQEEIQGMIRRALVP